MAESRYRRTSEQEEMLKNAMEEPRARLKAALLDLCHIDEEMGAAAIKTAIRAYVPVVLQHRNLK